VNMNNKEGMAKKERQKGKETEIVKVKKGI
jgi:hypothetical protein